MLLPRLVDSGAIAKHLDRSVYVIRLAGNFAISYPDGESPAVYVGEGSFGSRIAFHKKWARKLEELVGEFKFQVCVATPRVKNQPNTYLDCEAAVLHRFGERFGSAPSGTSNSSGDAFSNITTAKTSLITLSAKGAALSITGH